MNKLKVLFEDSDIVVINKPAGMIVEKNKFEKSVEDLVEQHLIDNGKKRPYIGIVHRLDRVTSGVLVLAKKKSILRTLNEEFSQRRVKKEYWAMVELPIKKETAVLKAHLERDKINKQAIIHDTAKKGTQPCELSYQIIEQNDQYALLRIWPITGRFHQIRAQLSNIGNPILGDIKYGGQKKGSTLKIALHAARLTVYHPIKKKRITFHCLPEFSIKNA